MRPRRVLASGATLVMLTACAAVTGLDAFDIVDLDASVPDAGLDGAPIILPTGTASSAPPPPATDSGVDAEPDARSADADVDAGAISPNATVCSATLSCPLPQVCCFILEADGAIPPPTCAASAEACGPFSYGCDETSDCASGSVCCVTLTGGHIAYGSACVDPTRCYVDSGSKLALPACTPFSPCAAGETCTPIAATSQLHYCY